MIYCLIQSIFQQNIWYNLINIKKIQENLRYLKGKKATGKNGMNLAYISLLNQIVLEDV